LKLLWKLLLYLVSEASNFTDFSQW